MTPHQQWKSLLPPSFTIGPYVFNAICYDDRPHAYTLILDPLNAQGPRVGLPEGRAVAGYDCRTDTLKGFYVPANQDPPFTREVAEAVAENCALSMYDHLAEEGLIDRNDELCVPSLPSFHSDSS